jgi:hypothetical protein
VHCPVSQLRRSSCQSPLLERRAPQSSRKTPTKTSILGVWHVQWRQQCCEKVPGMQRVRGSRSALAVGGRSLHEMFEVSPPDTAIRLAA